MKRKIITFHIFILCGILTSCLGVFYVDLEKRYAWLDDRTIMRIKEETKDGLYGDCIIRQQVLKKAKLRPESMSGMNWNNI